MNKATILNTLEATSKTNQKAKRAVFPSNGREAIVDNMHKRQGLKKRPPDDDSKSCVFQRDAKL